jgi:hypothetical protein
MKKFTFIFTFVAAAFGLTNAQTTFVTAPSNVTTTQVRAPNGFNTHAFLRASSLVLASELTGIPAATTLTSIGFTTTAGADMAVSGTMTVYLQNSSDVTFSKGTTWSTILTGMGTAYVGTYTVPASATTIDLNLTTPFVYTGGAIYVAYDFASAGPYASTTPATYGANSALAGGCVSASSTSVAPTTLGTTAFRPSFRFGFLNTISNDMSVETINTLGTVAQTLGLPVPISAIVKNNGNATLNNVVVSANMTGANTYTNNQLIASIASGATATVNFALWTPLAMGASTLNVTVPVDQVNTNNAKGFNNVVSCNTSGNNQNPSNYTQSVGFNTASGILSTPLQAPIATTVTGVNIAISTNTANVGNGVYGVILDNAGTILATSTNTLAISAGDFNTVRSFSFSPAVAVAASQLVYLGMAQPANTTLGYYPFGAYLNPYLSTSYFTNAITGGTLALLTANLGQFGIEANFAGTCGPMGINNAVVSSDNNVTVYPNPASTTLNVKLGSVTDKATVVVYNAIGQIVIASQEVNDNSTEINVSNLVKGVYILKVSNGKEVSNTKFVIER